MRILMISMQSIHFTRWTNQLKDCGFEVFWFDINDSGYNTNLPWVNQITGWKKRLLKSKGRYFLKKQLPKFYRWFSRFIDHDLEQTFEKVLLEVKPDVVHSFALYVSCSPILQVMNKYSQIKWIYSSWGSDLFYYQNDAAYLVDIKNVLVRVNYMFSDCKRDFELAKKYGFQGDFLGVFPGGGGFKFEELKSYILPFEKRKIILVKGYENRSGRSINVVKALQKIYKDLKDFEVVFFLSSPNLFEYLKANKSEIDFNYQILDNVDHLKMMKIMGESLIYIGNSNSDGIPNTLLEAMGMGAFPIQSNPGGASSEIIKNGYNGLLINDCESINEIKAQISHFLNNKINLNQSLLESIVKIHEEFDNNTIKSKVITTYKSIL